MINLGRPISDDLRNAATHNSWYSNVNCSIIYDIHDSIRIIFWRSDLSWQFAFNIRRFLEIEEL